MSAILGRRSWPRELVVGALLVSLIALAALLWPWLVLYDPAAQHYTIELGGEVVLSPFPPCPPFPLGTDDLGRDLLSRIIAGAQPTLLIGACVLTARLLLGVVLGLVAGWFGGWVDEQVMLVASWVSALPSLLLAIVLLEVFGGQRSLAGYVVALCLVGWPDVAVFIRQEVQNIARAPFVEGAVAIGSGSLGILRRHALPNLAPSLWPLVALEASSVLLLVAELGFLGYFVGGGIGVTILRGSDATASVTLVDRIPEWGQMVGAGREKMLTAPWMLIVPGAAFAWAILGFNLLGEGLRKTLGQARPAPVEESSIPVRTPEPDLARSSSGGARP